jgi:O-antigen ligase
MMAEANGTSSACSPHHPSTLFSRIQIIFLLSCAAALGCALAAAAGSSVQMLLLICGGACCLCGILLWRLMDWQLVPIAQVVLLSSFFFRFEINLFPIFKYHENPPGLLISLNLLASLFLLTAHIVEGRRQRESGSGWPLSYSLIIVALWLWCSLSLVYAKETWLAFCSLWSFSANSLMCYVVARTFTNRKVLRVTVIVIAVAIAINGLVAMLQTSAGLITNIPILGTGSDEKRQFIGEGEILRAVGFQEAANGFAWNLVTVLPLLLALVTLPSKDFRRREWWLFVAAAALGMIGLVLTFARGSWSVFILSLPVYAALAYRALPRDESRRFAKRIALGVALVIPLCLPFAGSIYTRLTEDDRGAAYSRKPLMEVAQAMIADNPWLGVGLSSYEAEMRRYDKTTDRVTDDFDWPVHNIFMHITAEAGIPAIVCFLALIAIALQRGWRSIRSRDPFLRALSVGLITGTLAFLMTGVKELGSVGSPQFRQLFLWCGLMLAVDHVRRQDDEGVMKIE